MAEPIRLRDWKEVIHMDFPPVRMQDGSMNYINETAQSGRYAPLPVRLATGRYFREEEFQARRAEELARPLP